MYKSIVLYDKACKEAQKKNYIMMNTLIGVGICVVNNSPFSSHITDSDKIKIRDGTNGNLYVLVDENALSLSRKVADLNVKVGGVNAWSSGYRYKIEFFVGENMEEIIIKSENSFVKGLFTYESNEDIINLVESVIRK